MSNPYAEYGDILTNRESQVIVMIPEGLSNKQIGDILGVSESCIKHHVGNIMLKTGINNRVQLAVAYVKGELNV